ncbi:hypothetical protein NPIL_223241 [Nephila pilipes]|uniref:Uncharacterized protein n=1 Tax=Nephila pilipes TaxID=299642 RepID=A0A8X6JBN5_NEPPI|nr:hypothetical protein NPIL_223241 [Nephila pilipes]
MTAIPRTVSTWDKNGNYLAIKKKKKKGDLRENESDPNRGVILLCMSGLTCPCVTYEFHSIPVTFQPIEARHSALPSPPRPPKSDGPVTVSGFHKPDHALRRGS